MSTAVTLPSECDYSYIAVTSMCRLSRGAWYKLHEQTLARVYGATPWLPRSMTRLHKHQRPRLGIPSR